MVKDIIFCIIGATCSGKSTLIHTLIEEYPSINYIESYTTRPERYEGEIGHHFVTKSDYFKQKQTEELFCVDKYLGNYYWMKKSQYRGKGISIFPIEANGFSRIKEEVTDAEIYAVYLDISEDNMRTRLKERNKVVKTLDIESIITNDKKLFLENKSLHESVDFIIDNNNPIQTTLQQIIATIDKCYALSND